ncbi:MAG: hypothetical protein VB144_06645 [Clostridia bacterium]|nr:hypothetical protein [Clostridia bacterium]
MRKGLTVGLVMVILISALSVAAMERFKQIEGWASFREDTKMMQGALENTLTYSAQRTHIPGVGMVFVMQSRGSIAVDQVRKEFEKALKYVVPSVESLPDDEMVVLSLSDATYGKEWEVMYITTKADASNPEAWTVYYNERSTR